MPYSALPDLPETPFDALVRYARRFPLLTGEEERTLVRRYQAGDLAAKERMVSSNLRLVIKIASQYTGVSSLTLAELVHEGVVGLIRAAEKFDWRRGLKFSTYAVPWIRQAVQRASFDRGADIRLPIHVAQRQVKVTRVRAGLAVELGREPTEAETARRAGLTVAQVAAVGTLPRVSCSLDAPLSDEPGPGTMQSTLAAEQPGPEREAADRDWAHAVRALLDRLPTAQAAAVAEQFELAPSAPHRDRRGLQRHRELVRRGLAGLAAQPDAHALRLAA